MCHFSASIESHGPPLSGECVQHPSELLSRYMNSSHDTSTSARGSLRGHGRVCASIASPTSCCMYGMLMYVWRASIASPASCFSFAAVHRAEHVRKAWRYTCGIHIYKHLYLSTCGRPGDARCGTSLARWSVLWCIASHHVQWLSQHTQSATENCHT